MLKTVLYFHVVGNGCFCVVAKMCSVPCIFSEMCRCVSGWRQLPLCPGVQCRAVPALGSPLPLTVHKNSRNHESGSRIALSGLASFKVHVYAVCPCACMYNVCTIYVQCVYYQPSISCACSSFSRSVTTFIAKCHFY